MTWTNVVTITVGDPARLIASAEAEILTRINDGLVPLRLEQTGENSITIWFGRRTK